MGNVPEFIAHVAGAFFGQLGQYLEEELVEFVKIPNQPWVEEGPVAAVVVFDELCFEQFEEQDAVHPGDAKLQGDAKKLRLPGIAVIGGPGHAAPALGGFQGGDGIFEQGAGLPPLRSASADDPFAAFFHFFQPEQVEQFVVETFVERIAVIGKGQLEQVRRGKDLEQRDELAVVGRVGIAERLFEIPDVEMGRRQFRFQFIQEWSGNIPVKKIGSGLGFPAVFPVVVGLAQVFVLVKNAVKNGGIKNKPVVDIRNDEVFHIRVAVVDAFLQVIKHQLVYRLGIAVGGADHIRGVLRAFHLEEHGGLMVSRPAFMDDEVRAAFGVQEMFVLVPGIVQKIPEVIFGILLAFFAVDAVEQAHQIGLERLDIRTVGFDLLVSLVKRFFERDEYKFHRGVIAIMNTGGKIRKIELTLYLMITQNQIDEIVRIIVADSDVLFGHHDNRRKKHRIKGGIHFELINDT